jgi:hypothetical protein
MISIKIPMMMTVTRGHSDERKDVRLSMGVLQNIDYGKYRRR